MSDIRVLAQRARALQEEIAALVADDPPSGDLISIRLTAPRRWSAWRNPKTGHGRRHLSHGPRPTKIEVSRGSPSIAWAAPYTQEESHGRTNHGCPPTPDYAE